MNWKVSIPYQHRDEPLINTASFARHIPAGDDRQVARQIVFGALDRGVRTAGDLLDELGKLAPGERRALLDQARVATGLPDTDTIETRQRIHNLVTKVDVGPSLQSCHGPDCKAVPTTPEGAWRPVNVRRWWCPAHEELAAPGDMVDQGSGLRLSPSGVPIPTGLDDQREQAAAESHRAQQRARDADRAADAVTAAEHARAKREAIDRELPPHLRRTT